MAATRADDRARGAVCSLAPLRVQRRRVRDERRFTKPEDGQLLGGCGVLRAVRCPYVQIIDAPMLQMGDRLVEVLRRLDTAVVEQDIEVPKLSIDSIPLRSVLCEPQMAEQLVEVARMVYLDTEVFKVSSQNRVFFILMSKPSTFQFQAMVIVEVFKVFPRDKVRSVVLSRSLTFLLVGVFKIFSLILVWQLSPQFRVKRLGKGFFALFHDFKKVRSQPGALEP